MDNSKLVRVKRDFKSSHKWRTPQKSFKTEPSGRRYIEPGDLGIWATCTRGMEGKCAEELLSLFEMYAEKFYNFSNVETMEDGENRENESKDIDIETTIQKEIASLKKSRMSQSLLFQNIHLELSCVLFMKVNTTRIDPVDFVESICKSIEGNNEEKMISRYANRLTPVSLLCKATETGLEELCGQILSRYFKVNESLSNNLNQLNEKIELKEMQRKNVEHPFTYAIRPTIRNHNTLKRDQLIKQIASYISDFHKVNLTDPDKVIIVEVYRNICGMSVVNGRDWERLKRYNISELYSSRNQEKQPKPITQ